MQFERPHHQRIAHVLSALNGATLRAALTKGEQAYGPSVARDLGKAIDRLQHRAGWLERCMQVMAMKMPKAV